MIYIITYLPNYLSSPSMGGGRWEVFGRIWMDLDGFGWIWIDFYDFLQAPLHDGACAPVAEPAGNQKHTYQSLIDFWKDLDGFGWTKCIYEY